MGALFFPALADEAPVFSHQGDVLRGQAGGNVEFAVGNTAIDLQLGHIPAVHENIEIPSAPFDAERIERELAMIVQFKENPEAAVGCPVRREGRDVALGDGGRFLDHHFAPGGAGLQARGENTAVVGIALQVDAQGGAGLSRLHRSGQEKREECSGEGDPSHARLIKGLTLFATLAEYPLMKRTLAALLLAFAMAAGAVAQEPETPARRSWFSRLNPFSRSEKLPEYKDPQLRGLVLTLELSPQPIKLSEVRQMKVKLTLTNKAKRPITLEFPDAQRFEIYLRNSSETVLATWSDNHAFADVVGTVFINPEEHIEYAETIATRELMPNKVFIAEIFFPKYPELRVRQKFLTAP